MISRNCYIGCHHALMATGREVSDHVRHLHSIRCCLPDKHSCQSPAYSYTNEWKLQEACGKLSLKGYKAKGRGTVRKGGDYLKPQNKSLLVRCSSSPSPDSATIVRLCIKRARARISLGTVYLDWCCAKPAFTCF